MHTFATLSEEPAFWCGLLLPIAIVLAWFVRRRWIQEVLDRKVRGIIEWSTDRRGVSEMYRLVWAERHRMHHATRKAALDWLEGALRSRLQDADPTTEADGESAGSSGLRWR